MDYVDRFVRLVIPNSLIGRTALLMATLEMSIGLFYLANLNTDVGVLPVVVGQTPIADWVYAVQFVFASGLLYYAAYFDPLPRASVVVWCIMPVILHVGVITTMVPVNNDSMLPAVYLLTVFGLLVLVLWMIALQEEGLYDRSIYRSDFSMDDFDRHYETLDATATNQTDPAG